MSTTSSKTLDEPGSLEPDLSSNAITVLKDRYLARDYDGQVAETPTELLRRVARTIAAPEETWGTPADERARIEEEFYRLMRQPAGQPKVSPKSVAAIVDAFLGWVQKHRSPHTYEWYRYRGKVSLRDL